MAYRGDIFAAGQYYHIYNRGAGRGLIFFNKSNYEYLLRLVGQYDQKCGVTILAYCLMPNHYHFLLRQETDQALSRFINLLFSTYVQALNIQQERTGTLFEGRFRCIRVDNWEYLMCLCRYIHLNPVKARLVANPEDWPYSNYLEWVELRNGSLLDKSFVQDHFQTPQEYREFVQDIVAEKKSYEKIKHLVWD
jgi:REP element-mobilizing transposase RayT